jgi:hypothetical protein
MEIDSVKNFVLAAGQTPPVRVGSKPAILRKGYYLLGTCLDESARSPYPYTFLAKTR